MSQRLSAGLQETQTSPVPPEVIPKKWTLHGLNNGFVFGVTVRAVRVLPRWMVYTVAHVATWLAWRLMHVTNAALAANLAAVLPMETEARLHRRALGVYRNYARDTIDFLRALSASPGELRQTFDLGTHNQAIFDEVLEQGRGGLLVTGHCGNWEIGGLLMSRVVNLPLTVVAMAEPDPDVNRLRQDIRSRMGIETLEVRQSLDTALQIRRLLSANRFVAMLIDRHMGRDRVSVTLFGRQAWFLQTPALLGYLTGAPLVPCFIERVGPGRFTTLALRPIHVDRTLPRDAAVRQATQQMADAVAARVSANPECWYQFYRYWDAQDDAYHGLS